jgi:hypothetical protein
MTDNAKRAITFSIFALGLILGLLGWAGDVYSSGVATVLFIAFLLASIALRIMWGLKR